MVEAFEIIHCSVDTIPNGNGSLLDRRKIYEEFSDELIAYLKKQGVKCQKLSIVARGGGGGSWLSELSAGIKTLWQLKDSLTILFSIASLIIKSIY
jgi:hypothetical protein